MHTSPPSRSETSVAVIDQPNLFAESLLAALALAGYDAHLVSAQAATSAPDRLPGLRERPPRIAILDLDLDESLALRILRPLAAGGTQVVVVTASDEHALWGECLSSGAVGVLRKTAPLADVLEVVGRLEEGLPIMSTSERRALMDEWRDRTRTSREVQRRFARLDSFERWVLTRLLAGYALHEIAQEGPLSQTMVNKTVASVVEKLGVPTWLEAVNLADEQGWSPADAVR